MVELNEVLDRLKQGPSQSPQRIETSDTSGDETDASQGRRKVLSKKTYGKKKVYVDKMARSKCRLFHLILEICKSRLHTFHPALVGTYTFRRIWRVFQETCGNVPGFLFWDIWLFTGPSHYAGAALSGSRCWRLGARVGCFQCFFPSHDGLGISSSTDSPLLDSAGRTRSF